MEKIIISEKRAFLVKVVNRSYINVMTFRGMLISYVTLDHTINYGMLIFRDSIHYIML
jgi:hypothetical protein